MAEGYVTTHVLDAGRGVPAAGMRIDLYRIEGEARSLVRSVVTNSDGRTDSPVIPKGEPVTGTWELLFHAGAYLDAAAETLLRGRGVRGKHRARTRAAIAHALSFATWRSLVGEQQLPADDAAALMSRFVRAAAAS